MPTVKLSRQQYDQIMALPEAEREAAVEKVATSNQRPAIKMSRGQYEVVMQLPEDMREGAVEHIDQANKAGRGDQAIEEIKQASQASNNFSKPIPLGEPDPRAILGGGIAGGLRTAPVVGPVATGVQLGGAQLYALGQRALGGDADASLRSIRQAREASAAVHPGELSQMAQGVTEGLTVGAPAMLAAPVSGGTSIALGAGLFGGTAANTAYEESGGNLPYTATQGVVNAATGAIPAMRTMTKGAAAGGATSLVDSAVRYLFDVNAPDPGDAGYRAIINAGLGAGLALPGSVGKKIGENKLARAKADAQAQAQAQADAQAQAQAQADAQAQAQSVVEAAAKRRVVEEAIARRMEVNRARGYAQELIREHDAALRAGANRPGIGGELDLGTEEFTPMQGFRGSTHEPDPRPPIGQQDATAMGLGPAIDPYSAFGRGSAGATWRGSMAGLGPEPVQPVPLGGVEPRPDYVPVNRGDFTQPPTAVFGSPPDMGGIGRVAVDAVTEAGLSPDAAPIVARGVAQNKTAAQIKADLDAAGVPGSKQAERVRKAIRNVKQTPKGGDASGLQEAQGRAQEVAAPPAVDAVPAGERADAPPAAQPSGALYAPQAAATAAEAASARLVQAEDAGYQAAKQGLAVGTKSRNATMRRLGFDPAAQEQRDAFLRGVNRHKEKFAARHPPAPEETPEQRRATEEAYRQAEEDAVTGHRAIVRQQVESEAASMGWVPWKHGKGWTGYDLPGKSEYIKLHNPATDDVVTVRVSDHAQPTEGGWRIAADGEEGRLGASDVSLVAKPGEAWDMTPLRQKLAEIGSAEPSPMQALAEQRGQPLGEGTAAQAGAQPAPATVKESLTTQPHKGYTFSIDDWRNALAVFGDDMEGAMNKLAGLRRVASKSKSDADIKDAVLEASRLWGLHGHSESAQVAYDALMNKASSTRTRDLADHLRSQTFRPGTDPIQRFRPKANPDLRMLRNPQEQQGQPLAGRTPLDMWGPRPETPRGRMEDWPNIETYLPGFGEPSEPAPATVQDSLTTQSGQPLGEGTAAQAGAQPAAPPSGKRAAPPSAKNMFEGFAFKGKGRWEAPDGNQIVRGKSGYTALDANDKPIAGTDTAPLTLDEAKQHARDFSLRDDAGVILNPLEAARELAGLASRAGAKAKDVGQEWFTARGNLPKSAFTAAEAAMGKKGRFAYRMQYDIRAVERAERKEYGAAGAGDLIKAYLEGNTAVPLKPRTKAAADDVRRTIDDLSQQAVDIGAVGDRMAATVIGNKGVYLKRSYRVHSDPAWADTAMSTPEIREPMRKLLRAEHPKWTDAQIVGHMNEMLRPEGQMPSARDFYQSGKLGRMDLSSMIRRKDLAPEVRAFLGENTDYRIAVAKSVDTLADMIAMKEFQDSVVKAGTAEGWIFDQATGNAYQEISAASNRAMGNMAGKYTYPEVAKAIDEYFFSAPRPQWVKAWQAFQYAVRAGKTIGNVPAGPIRNFVANPAIAFTSGDLGLFQVPEMMTALPKTWGQMNKGAQEAFANAFGESIISPEFLQRTERLIELGVMDQNVISREMRTLLKDWRSGGSKAGAAIKRLGDIYQWGDEFWRVFGFESKMKQYEGFAQRNNMSREQLEEFVAGRVRDMYPDYGRLSKAVRTGRGFVDFIAWPSEIVRTSANVLRITAEELRSGDPDLMRIAAKRAVNIASSAIAPTVGALMLGERNGVDREKQDAIREFLPPWTQNGLTMFLGPNEKGQHQYIDGTFTDPHAVMRKPIHAIMRGEDWEESFMGAAMELIGNFAEPGMSPKAIVEAIMNKKDTGGAIYGPSMTPTEKAAAMGQYIFDRLQPGSIGAARRIYKGAAGIQDPTGRTYDAEKEIKAQLTGTRVGTVDVPLTLQFTGGDFQREIADATRMYNLDIKRGIDRASALETVNRRREAAFYAIQRKVDSAKKLGLTPKEIIDALKRGGVGSDNIKAMLRGVVLPYKPDTNSGLPKLPAMPALPSLPAMAY